MHPSISAELDRLIRWARDLGAELDEVTAIVQRIYREEVPLTTPDQGATLLGPQPLAATEVAPAPAQGLSVAEVAG